MLKQNSLYLGDCIDLFEKVEDHTIDLIFLDPPYNLQLNKVLTRPNHSVVNGVTQDWDKFDNYASYDEFTLSYLSECKRVLKKDGILIMYTVPEMVITSAPKEHTVVQKNIFSRLLSIIFPQSSKQEAEEPANEQFSTSRYSLINFDDAVAKRSRPEKNIPELIIPGSGFTNMAENDFNYLNKNIFQNL